MRILFLGAGEVTVYTAETLIAEGHEVVIIEPNAERIEELADKLDCSFLHGDGGRIAILEEAGVEDADAVFCVTDDDKVNILAGLVARQFGVERVVVSIEDAELEPVADSLDLTTVIVPGRAIARQLHDLVRGIDSAELSTSLEHGARLFRFRIGKDAKRPADLDLPADTHALWYYRDDDYHRVDDDTEFRPGDDVVLLTNPDHLEELSERWHRDGNRKRGRG